MPRYFGPNQWRLAWNTAEAKVPRITSEPATKSSAVDGVAPQSKECDAHGGLLIALGFQVTVRENCQYCDGRFLHESVYSTRIRALAPMFETVDGGGVGHEKRSAHDGISEMAVVYCT